MMPKVVWMQMAFGEPLAYASALEGSTAYLNRDWLRAEVEKKKVVAGHVEIMVLDEILALIDNASEGGGG